MFFSLSEASKRKRTANHPIAKIILKEEEEHRHEEEEYVLVVYVYSLLLPTPC